MSFPQLGYPQYLSASQAVYGSERPGVLTPSSRGGSTEIGGSPSATATAVTSVLGMYANPYVHNYSAFLPYTSADLALFSQMGPQYELKDGPGVHPATFAAHTSPAFYSYGQFQYGDPARPKNATRESTSTLKAWLNEHRKNPYPTKGEKIMLAIITKMTLTQVSTWFANARRRLKKENKMTWPPRNKGSEEKRFDDEEDGSPEEQIKSENNDDETRSRADKDLQLSDLDDFDTLESENSECEMKHRYHMNAHMSTTTDCSADQLIKNASLKISLPLALGVEQDLGKSCLKANPESFPADGRAQAKPCYNQQQAHQLLDGKPRIWSLAQTATSLNQTEYPSCMLRCQPPPSSLTPSPAATSPVTGLDNRQDSPVTTLRNWVDGVFHDPLFRHSTLSQALTNTTVSWTTNTKGAILEAERSAAAIQQHQNSPKDSPMSFPKTGNKLFCS